MTSLDPRYVAARRVLLDALTALDKQSGAFVIAGAQAVYLHTGESDLAIAPFTTDADLSLDPSRLAADPLLEAAMRDAGFELAIVDGHVEPGPGRRKFAWTVKPSSCPSTSSSPKESLHPKAGAAHGSASMAAAPHDEPEGSRQVWSTTTSCRSPRSKQATSAS